MRQPRKRSARPNEDDENYSDCSSCSGGKESTEASRPARTRKRKERKSTGQVSKERQRLERLRIIKHYNENGTSFTRRVTANVIPDGVVDAMEIKGPGTYFFHVMHNNPQGDAFQLTDGGMILVGNRFLRAEILALIPHLCDGVLSPSYNVHFFPDLLLALFFHHYHPAFGGVYENENECYIGVSTPSDERGAPLESTGRPTLGYDSIGQHTYNGGVCQGHGLISTTKSLELRTVIHVEGLRRGFIDAKKTFKYLNGETVNISFDSPDLRWGPRSSASPGVGKTA